LNNPATLVHVNDEFIQKDLKSL